jgi:CubicO group peptidase (beta-lactamase class C family)
VLVRRFAPLRLVLLVCAAACREPATPSRSERQPADVAASIARVEHGLIEEIRVEGDPPGWTIEERLRAHHTPAVSIAVIHDHRVAWAKAYGWQSLETHTRADANTLFQAASISKMVTALAALEQADAGRVAVDADINLALRSWKLPENDLTRATPVTLKQLLSHTAGTNVHTVDGYPEGSKLPTLQQVLDGTPPATTPAVRVEHAPGKAFDYSGGGSLVVQQLVVDLSAKPFATALDHAVFAPLGLRSSSFEVPLPAPLYGRRATPYDIDETPLPPLVYPESAPAGLWSTPTDLARFLVEVQLGLEGKSNVVSKRVATWMTTPIAPVGPPEVWTGMGTFIEKHGALTYFGHDGWNDGFLSMSRAMIDRGDGAVVMTNGAGGAQVLFEVMRSIAVEYHWDGWLPPPIEPARLSREQLASFVGRYRGEGAALGHGAMRISVKGDRLSGREALRAPLELIPVGADTFVSRADGTRLTFRRDANGKLEIDEVLKGDHRVLAQIADDVVEPADLLAVGRYDEALIAYRAARAKRPGEPSSSEAYLDELGRDLLDKRFEIASALDVYRIDAALYPSSATANAALAFAYLRAGRLRDGEPYYAKATSLRGHDGTHSEMENVYLNWRLSRFKAARKP